jgi:hypothetical protein
MMSRAGTTIRLNQNNCHGEPHSHRLPTGPGNGLQRRADVDHRHHACLPRLLEVVISLPANGHV